MASPIPVGLLLPWGNFVSSHSGGGSEVPCLLRSRASSHALHVARSYLADKEGLSACTLPPPASSLPSSMDTREKQSIVPAYPSFGGSGASPSTHSVSESPSMCFPNAIQVRAYLSVPSSQVQPSGFFYGDPVSVISYSGTSRQTDVHGQSPRPRGACVDGTLVAGQAEPSLTVPPDCSRRPSDWWLPLSFPQSITMQRSRRLITTRSGSSPAAANYLSGSLEERLPHGSACTVVHESK